MKIAYCIPSLYIPGGMERVLTIKANYFADIYGYEVFIILTDGKNKTPYYQLSPNIHLINLDINYDELNGQTFYKRLPKYLLKQQVFKRKLRKCLMTLKPDISISMLRREINFINSIQDGSKKIGEIHVNKSNFRDFNEEKASPVKKLLARIWMKQLIGELKKLDKFVTLSHEDKDKWTEIDHVIAIHNPLSFFPEKVSDCSNSQVIAVGRLIPQKGFDMLIDAWKIVSDRHPEWTLRIYGECEQKEYLAQINRLNLENTCKLEGAVYDIVNKYLESSIFVLSSRFEGFGMVITEAMACGLPAVSFACPCGPKDIINEGKDGFLVEPENIEKLADRIIYLIENDDIRKKMGMEARANTERFRMEKIASEWKTMFESLLLTQQETGQNPIQ